MSGSEDGFRDARRAMVRDQIVARGVADPRVLAAMETVERHRFVARGQWAEAYDDRPLPIGPMQTISQPYIVAYMAEALRLQAHERVLEVGSGCGYFAAVLGQLAREVCGVELVPELAAASAVRLRDLGCGNVRIRCGDGAAGWPERAPFDAIVLSCAAPALPAALWEQLAADGRALLPETRGWPGQQLVLHRRGGTESVELLPVAFVPLRGGP